jgi:hypothetical protein
MDGEVEDLSLHITSSSLHILLLSYDSTQTEEKIQIVGLNTLQPLELGHSPRNMSQAVALQVSTHKVQGLNLRGLSFRGLFHGITHSLQTNPAQQMWATSSTVSTPCR